MSHSEPTSIPTWINPHILELPAKSPGPHKSLDAIRLDKGELPFPPSPHVQRAIAQATATSHRYPEVTATALRQALAHYTGLASEQIIVGNGSDDLIELLLKVIAQPGDEVIIPIPSFFVYWFSAQLLGLKPVFVQRTPDFCLDVAQILRQVTPRTKLLFLANPNNPTANYTPKETIVQILDQVSCPVVVDECYYEMCQSTVADLLTTYPQLIILRSFSKSFGLAGLRVGYALAHPSWIDALYRAAQLFPVNQLAIVGAIAALEDMAYAQANWATILQERQHLAIALTNLGLTVYPSVTNFLFIGTEPLNRPSPQLVTALQQQNIFVADFGLKLGLDNYFFRTSVGTAAENQALITGLQACLL